MTLGEKIKSIRKSRGMTQSALCENLITRNMLSQIESGKASPSLDTLKAISERLEVSLSYLVSEEDSLFLYEKLKKIKRIKELYLQHRFGDCIKEASNLSEGDDEIYLILADCYFNIGKHYALYGYLNKGLSALNASLEYSNKTIYDTTAINAVTVLFIALCKNAKSPLLELDSAKYERVIENNFEYELYKYITKDYSYNFKNENLKNHILAKEKMSKRDYRGALEVLMKIEANKKDYNAHVFLSVYSDIDRAQRSSSIRSPSRFSLRAKSICFAVFHSMTCFAVT
jgi:transcriptional regulator with XRE-family HTH domain